MLNVNTWKFAIAPITVVVIVTSLMAFGSGEFIVNLLYYKRKQRVLYIQPESPIHTSFTVILVLCAVLGILLIHYYNETVEMAKVAGYKNGPLMLMYARKIANRPVAGHINHDIIGLHSKYIAEALAYCYSYIFLYNTIFFNKKNKKNILPILIYIPYIVLSTGRTRFIYLIAVWIIVGCIFYMQKKQWNPQFIGKVLKFGFLGIFIFLVIFIFAGSLRSSIFLEDTWMALSGYIGFSIPSLNDFILHPRPQGVYFGEHTLFGIYQFLRKIGFVFPSFYAPYEFFTINGYTGNIYTIIRRYLEDFGYFGLYFILFFIGFLYSVLFLMINKKRNFALLLYAIIFFPVVEMAIEERFFMVIVSTSTIISAMYVAFFYSIFIEHNLFVKKQWFSIEVLNHE
ncbi:hypothetical protein FACS189444_3020 [Spirochaetia bacterium]|nr:hypothetical protein FACS189444_3020 [Spirochaetia bacterium]